jgi:hypothetical protein
VLLFTTMDRRQHARFDLSGRVWYSWKDGQGTRRTARGVARDVSECGLYVFTDSRPPVGTAIRFEVSFSFRDDSEIRMRARGKVLRIEPEREKTFGCGFAVATKRVWFGKTTPPVKENF